MESQHQPLKCVLESGGQGRWEEKEEGEGVEEEEEEEECDRYKR